MKILVINGSPKGKLSLTQQFVTWVEQNHPEHSFERLGVARSLKKMESDGEYTGQLIQRMAEADAIWWATPVYYFLVPSQLKRFIELLFQEGAAQKLAGGYSSALTTSVHFFDHTAMEYLQAISEDLGLRHLPGFSAHTHDLLSGRKRTQLELYAHEFFRTVADRVPLQRRFPDIDQPALKYRPGRVRGRSDSGGPRSRAVLISDARDGDSNLKKMEQVLCSSLSMEVERIDLSDLDFRPCIGCIRCGWDGQCVHGDGFADLYRQRILTADALIFSGVVRDRYLSARFKRFFDRSFFLGHQPVLAGKQMLWLLSGPMSRLATLRHVLESHAQVMHINLVGMVSDEAQTSKELTGYLREAALRLERGLSTSALRPRMFPGLGGMLVLRDFVYLTTFVFQADHKFYLRHGVYNFPYKKLGKLLFDRTMGLAMCLPPVRKRIQRDMRKLMLRPFAELTRKHKSARGD